MKHISWATPLYKFLRYCNSSSLQKTVLDCGAGGHHPPLHVFADYGYEAYGIEISGEALKHVQEFCTENDLELGLLKGDMRKLPVVDEAFSFVYTYNAIHMLAKDDIALAISEIERARA